MIGLRYARLTVIGNAPMEGRRGMVLCKCVCGAEKVIEARRVRKGLTKSCGCLQRDMSRAYYRRKGSMPRGDPLDFVDEDIVG